MNVIIVVDSNQPLNLEQVMNFSFKKISVKHLTIAAAISFLMLLTRGSHVLTSVALPDASLALLLIGGLYLRKAAWFGLFVALATVIDFGAAAIDPAQGFCLTDGYWGLIPSYAAMWLGGLWLANRKDAFQKDAFDVVPYALVSMCATFVAFVISTQTYYLFSGRFPAKGLVESLQHGWEYLPSWMGFSAMYFAIVWAVVKLARNLKTLQTTNA